MNKKYRLFLLCIGILLALSLMISASYALYIFTIGQEGENVVEADCFKITFNDNSPLSISDTIPLTEEEASDITPYTFTINNICNHAINYKINIETLNTTTMDLNAIRVKLDDNASKLLGSVPNNKQESIVNSNATSSKTINKGDLEANGTKTFGLKAWIDNNATYEQSANKIFASKVVVSATLRADEMAQLISGPLLNKAFKQLAGIEHTQEDEEEFESHVSEIRQLYDLINGNGEETYQQMLEEGTFGNNVPTYQEFIQVISEFFNSEPDLALYSTPDINIYNLIESVDSTITSIEFSEMPPAAGIETVVVSTDDSPIEAVAWKENETIYIYSEEETVNFNTNSSYAFAGFTKLRNIDLDHFDFTNVNLVNGLFLATYVNDDFAQIVNLANTTELLYTFGFSCVDISDYSIIDMSSINSMSGMFFGAYVANGNLGQLNTANVKNMSFAFSSLQGSSLELFNLTLDDIYNTPFSFSGLNTSNVTNMAGLFSDSKTITNLDLSSFDTSNVTNMSRMFFGMSGLTSIDLSPLDTSKVKDMSMMFSGMSGLTSIDLAPLNTSNVTDMSYIFNGMSGLTSIDLTPLDTSKVVRMNSMFEEMSGLTSIDLTPLDTSNVVGMNGMFKNMSSLTSIDLMSLDTSNVTDMSSMFSHTSSLTSVNLSTLNTSKVTDMSDMFEYTGNITTIDLSSFDFSNVKDIDGIFYNANKLTTIYVNNNTNLSNVEKGNNVFKGCTKLVGGSGTVYNSSIVDKSYARIDNPSDGKPGYFTLKIN